MKADDWILPSVHRGLTLDRGELLLLDWIICEASHLLPEASIRELLQWQPLRLKCWHGISLGGNYELELPENEANILLALCPTTFRWGVGDDVAFSLKLKLARFIAPEMFPNDDEAADRAQSAAQAADAAAENAGL